MEVDNADDNFAKLLEMVNEKEEIREEFTEEELKQVFSPQQHFELEDEEAMNDDRDDTNGNFDQQLHHSPANYSFKLMDHHIFKGKHGKKFYKCDVCNGIYRHSFSIKRHFIRAHINYAFLSEMDVINCGINLTSSASIQAWSKRVQNDGHLQSKVCFYCCHSCIAFFSTISEIRDHVDTFHRHRVKSGALESVKIACNYCNMTFIQQKNLLKHILMVHNNRDTLDDPKSDSSTELGRNQIQTITCDVCFFTCSSYTSLCSHFAHLHKALYNPCAFCRQFFKSKKKLVNHLRFVHSKSYNANSKQLERNETESSHNLSSLSFHHGNTANRSKVRTRSLAQSPTIKVSTEPLKYNPVKTTFEVRSNLASESAKFNVQSQSRVEQKHSSIGSSHHKKHNQDELNNIEISNFYRFLAQNISENLLFHVDGKPKPKTECSKVDVKELIRPKLNLTQYNIPVDFYSKEDEEENKIDLLLDCKLKSCQSVSNLNRHDLKETRELCSSLNSYKLYICDVCDKGLTSPKAFDDHELNNHPNVSCTFLEVDISCNIPSYLLNFKNNSPRGLLKKCKVPYLDQSLQNGSSIRCTKCSKCFSNTSLLHQHILDCASASLSSSSSLSPSFPSSKSVTLSSQDRSQCHISIPASSSSSFFSAASPTLFSSDISKLVGYNTRSSKKRKIVSNQDEVEFNLNERPTNSTLLNDNSNVTCEDSFIKDDNNNECKKEEMTIDKDNLRKNKSKNSKCVKNYLYMVTLKKHSRPYSKKVIIGDKRRCFKSLLNKPVIRRKESRVKQNMKRFKSIQSVENSNSQKEEAEEDEEESQEGQEENTVLSCTKEKSLSYADSKLALIKSEHRCPNCIRTFKYLGNFKKHIKAGCSSKGQNEINNGQVQEDKKDDCSNEKDLDENKVLKDEQDEDEEEEEEEEEIENEEDDDSQERKTDKSKIGSRSKRKLDLWRVKQKYPLYAFKGSPAQHHSCPYCRRGFTYLANFRRHTHADCPIINQDATLKRQPSNEEDEQKVPNNTGCCEDKTSDQPSLCKSKDDKGAIENKDVTENETCNQNNKASNQTDNRLESNLSKLNSNSLRFKTFSCNICHKIYFSYLQMLRHRFSHKLSGKSDCSASESLTDMKQEEALAKKALQDQEKRIKLGLKVSKNLNSNSSKNESSIKMPISNLLENLARGGTIEDENDDNNNDMNISDLKPKNGSLAKTCESCKDDQTLNKQSDQTLALIDNSGSLIVGVVDANSSNQVWIETNN